MKYVDGILAPGTIKTGAHVEGGMAWFTLGNSIAFVNPSHANDLVLVSDIVEALA